MIRREAGFTLVELMITMVIFVFVIAAASQIFVGLLTQFKQQSTIAETNIEGIVGLNIMRRDIENAGYGLPWTLPPAWLIPPCNAGYLEAGSAGVTILATPWTEINFNDGPPTNPTRGTDLANACNSPAAIRSGDQACPAASACPEDADVLIIKSTSAAAAQNNASHKWTYVEPGNTVKEWDVLGERLNNNDRVIVLSLTDTYPRGLIVDSGSFTTRYNATTAPDSLVDAAFAPLDTTDPRVVYGIDNPAAGVALRLPFNRADFYVRTPGTMPTKCAAGTGILYKATVNHGDDPATAAVEVAGDLTELPLLDCVADMQAYYRLDTDDNGTVDSDVNSIAGLTAEEIRTQLREIRVYVLAHEGQRDPNFTFNNFTGASTCATCIRVGQSAILGRDFDLLTITDTNRLNYRWKVYTIVVQTKNLR
ncbi:MAG: hypothetical protein A2X59_06770 [Nitrospirae bacterium GWC2_42_7]|nr:MAG: hypothetical protein A2X59_06770 [Nitrospirae bacterium GWC2_42_7]